MKTESTTSEQQRQFACLTRKIDERLGYMVYSEMGKFSTEGDAVFLRFYLTNLEAWLQKTWQMVGREVEE